MAARNLCGLLDAAAAAHPERPCLIHEDRSLGYGEVAARTRRLAAFLRSRGVSRGDRVLVLGANRAEAVMAVMATARLGAIFSVLHSQIREFGLRRIVEQMEPRVAFVDATTAGLAGALPGATLVWMGGGPAPEGMIAFDEAAREGAPEDERGFPGIDVDPVCSIYTSGSTGTPRGVVLTHDNILFVIDAIQERLGYRGSDVVGVFLPLSFDYGLYQVFLAFQVGAAVFLGSAELAGPGLFTALSAKQVSVLPGVPTLFAGMIKLIGRQGQRLPPLRVMTNTGAHLPQAHVDELRRAFPDAQIFLMYGLTECKRVSILRSTEIDARPGSVGRALQGTEVTIVDTLGRELPRGSVGQLVVRGRHVALGYWRAEEETAARFKAHPSGLGRVLYSGDSFRMDDDGYLYFVGRDDFLIKRHGFRVQPAEIEEVASMVPGILEAGVVHVPEGDRLVMFVTLAAEGDLQAATLLKAIHEKLEPHKLPSEIRALAELPKTPHGKLDRKKLAELVQPAQPVQSPEPR